MRQAYARQRRLGRPHIGVVGAGIAGLHLGLRLRQLGIEVTIISERTPMQIANGPLLNTAIHWHSTLQREAALNITPMKGGAIDFTAFRQIIHRHTRLDITAPLPAPCRAVDHRLYLPSLMDDFSSRGGRMQIGQAHRGDLQELADQFDLIVIASGRGELSSLFPRDPDHSPFDRPQRSILAGLFEGMAPDDSQTLTVSVAPGHGEAMEFPMLSGGGPARVLYLSEMPGGDLERFWWLAHTGNPHAFGQAVLTMLKHHHPTIYGRIDISRFTPRGPKDVLQSAITPAVRRGFATIGEGRFAIALGDARAALDPLLGQGANLASATAWMLAEAITKARALDRAFCEEFESQRAPRVLAASAWTNATLLPPDEAKIELLEAMSRNPALARAYIASFDDPEQQWRNVGSPEAIRGFIASAA